MRILIFLLFPLVGACQWSGITSNQTVSLNNLQNAVNTGVFTAKTSIPAGTKGITKAEANTYVNINTSNSTYAPKASNQLVVKQDLTPAAGVTYTVSSGTYPVSGGNSSAVINVTNSTGASIFIYAKFNSAGVSSGSLSAANNDYQTRDNLSFNYIVGSWSTPGYEILTTGFITITNGSTVAITLNKSDGLGSGSYMRIGYATSSAPYQPIYWL